MQNKKDTIAKEILSLLVKLLPDDFAEIKKAKENNDYNDLLKKIHKLHGALCYCNVPPLKNAAQALEKALRKNQLAEIPKLFTVFEEEIKKVLSGSRS